MKQVAVLVFIGPQGSGKGTQAALLADAYGFHIITMGDILREAAQNNYELGKEIAQTMVSGNFLPDELIVKLIQSELARLPHGSNIIFDGFPRTVEQARALDTLITVTRAVFIDLPYEVSIKRIAGRLVCPHGHNYNTYFLPPRTQGVCNVDKLPLNKREDDTEEAVRNRLDLYQKVTVKLEEYYRAQNKLIRINGNASVFEVSHEIKTKVMALL